MLIFTFKTRVFVTNALSFLPQSNNVIMMENGSIVGQGTYDELIHKTGDSFANYIGTYLNSKDSNIEDISRRSFLKILYF
jgi:ABC-type proline/glycine betaine transport system ATPase subunit